MGLAVTLSLVFLWVCLFHFGYQQEIRLVTQKSVCNSHGQASINVPTFYLYKLPVFSTRERRERVVEISYS